MKYIHDLPAPLGRAIVNDPYDAGDSDFTPSSLNEPARIRALGKRHEAELVSKTSASWWRLMGSLAHSVLERVDFGADCRKEERLFTDFEGHRIGGKYDLYVGQLGLAADASQTGELCLPPYSLWDFKTLKSYALVFAQRNGGMKDEWKSQLNVLAWLARRNGLRVDHIGIIPLLLDWSADEALDNEDYPRKPSLIIEGRLWTDEQVESWLRDKIARHLACGPDVADDELPLCTPEERWERAPKWAVMQKGKDRAAKLEDTEDAARAYIAKKGWEDILTSGLISLVFRPGRQVRCRAHCSVAKFCDFGRNELAKLEQEMT